MSRNEPQPAHRDFEAFVSWLRELRRKRKYVTIQLAMQAGEIVDVKPTVVVKPQDALPEL